MLCVFAWRSGLLFPNVAFGTSAHGHALFSRLSFICNRFAVTLEAD
jgi:hypothetical protein